jgi:hypothetical protein
VGGTGFGLGSPRGRDHWEDLGVGGRITLRRTLRREVSMGRTGSPDSGWGLVAGFYEHGNEPSNFIKKATIL